MHPRELLPWILGALVVVGVIVAALYLTRPPENLLPQVYGVM